MLGKDVMQDGYLTEIIFIYYVVQDQCARYVILVTTRVNGAMDMPYLVRPVLWMDVMMSSVKIRSHF